MSVLTVVCAHASQHRPLHCVTLDSQFFRFTPVSRQGGARSLPITLWTSGVGDGICAGLSEGLGFQCFVFSSCQTKTSLRCKRLRCHERLHAFFGHVWRMEEGRAIELVEVEGHQVAAGDASLTPDERLEVVCDFILVVHPHKHRSGFGW